MESVRRPKDPNGRPKSFGFIVFKHECSVPYAVELFRTTKLFNRNLNVNTRNTQLYHIPVLDTHLTEFTGLENRREDRRSCKSEEGRSDYRNHKGNSSGSRHHSKNEKNSMSSWSELKNDPSQASRFVSNGLNQDSFIHAGHSRGNMHPVIPDFNALLQMGQQMFPLVMGHQEIRNEPVMGLGPALGNGFFPSMQGRVSGGQRNSPPRELEQRSYHDREHRRDRERSRERRRDHPYDNRHHSSWQDHKRHERGYSSSRSTHDRERRDRRSR